MSDDDKVILMADAANSSKFITPHQQLEIALKDIGHYPLDIRAGSEP